jgi:hypothetical protein
MRTSCNVGQNLGLLDIMSGGFFVKNGNTFSLISKTHTHLRIALSQSLKQTFTKHGADIESICVRFHYRLCQAGFEG